ncbi:uncharacterized protein MYCGRDRAFT_97536 [Zymoseptoria tritici IPO323]|uniref:Uncharacterized protein n=1 Tax=Zymoseptoria tritici (strain CBS 115943 / IPO323) TaxID=336722 RepID=F9XQJ0_ZYMTI|nr:uncharacterized protein MYCGRDRAFT_97536 [Zymoseptoria tritici IPO323]EGP82369.1 hypothetical protein MYCGRDRAFT_97536 [Zymoseptoria tritici IPO323]
MSAGFGSKVGSNSPTALSVWASETDSLCCENEDTGSEMGDGSVDSCSSSPHTLRGNARRDDQIVCRCEIAMSELDDILALLQAALVDWEDPDQLLLRHGYCITVEDILTHAIVPAPLSRNDAKSSLVFNPSPSNQSLIAPLVFRLSELSLSSSSSSVESSGNSSNKELGHMWSSKRNLVELESEVAESSSSEESASESESAEDSFSSQKEFQKPSSSRRNEELSPARRPKRSLAEPTFEAASEESASESESADDASSSEEEFQKPCSSRRSVSRLLFTDRKSDSEESCISRTVSHSPDQPSTPTPSPRTPSSMNRGGLKSILSPSPRSKWKRKRDLNRILESLGGRRGMRCDLMYEKAMCITSQQCEVNILPSTSNGYRLVDVKRNSKTMVDKICCRRILVKPSSLNHDGRLSTPQSSAAD